MVNILLQQAIIFPEKKSASRSVGREKTVASNPEEYSIPRLIFRG